MRDSCAAVYLSCGVGAVVDDVAGRVENGVHNLTGGLQHSDEQNYFLLSSKL